MPEPTPTQPRLHLAPILVLAAVVRLITVTLTIRAHTTAWFFAQASELHELANSILAGHGLSSPFGGSTGPSAFLAPGYPLLVALDFHLFGPFSHNAEVALMLLQTLFAVATVLALMRLAQRMIGTRTAHLAGILWAISPPLIFLPTIFWETSLSIFLVTAIVALSLFCAQRSTTLGWIGLALCCLLALYTNPSLATTIVACFAWAIYQSRAYQPRTAPYAAALVCLLLFSLWPIRNWNALHAFIPLRTNLGYELWQGNRPGADGFFDASLHPNSNTFEFVRYKSLGELGYMREKSTLARAAIHANPTRFLGLCLKRFLSFWTGIGKQVSGLLATYTILTALLGFLGLYRLLRSHARYATLILIPLILLPLPYYLTHPDYRFRCVVDPLLTILSAYFLLTWLSPTHEHPTALD